MSLFTTQQIELLARIIMDHTSWIIWRILGESYITKQDLDRLKKQKLLPMDVSVSSIRYSFVLGQLEAVLKEAEWKNLDWEEVKEAATAKYSPTQEFQIQAAEQSAAVTLRNLSDDIRRDLFSKLRDATNQAVSESQVQGIVKDAVKRGVKLKQNHNKVTSELYEQTKELKRNWQRVAATELHAARQQGIVDAIISGTDIYEYTDGVNTLVSVIAASNACEDCRRLYTDNKTGNPKIFKLSTLLNNAGTNYIRPWRQNAKSVVPPLHPLCVCFLRSIPDGFEWNEEGKLRYKEE